MDHDRLFKELLTALFTPFVELFCPDVAAYMRPGPLEFLDKEVFTDVTSGRRHEVDLIVKARFRRGKGLFLVHVEHQSRHQKDFDRRMFHYFARLYEKFNFPIYPIALFSHKRPLHREGDRHRVIFPDRVHVRLCATPSAETPWRGGGRRPEHAGGAREMSRPGHPRSGRPL